MQWYTQWVKQGTLRPDTVKFTRELTFIRDFMKAVRVVLQYDLTLTFLSSMRLPSGLGGCQYGLVNQPVGH